MEGWNIARWFWSRLDVIAGVLAIPWGFFVLSLVLAGWSKVTKTSGSDIYVLLSSLDLEFVLFSERFRKAVYAGIQPKFKELFAVALIFSLILLAISSRVQRRIDEIGDATDFRYPSGQLFFCWAVALVWMAGHFFVILAR